MDYESVLSMARLNIASSDLECDGREFRNYVRYLIDNAHYFTRTLEYTKIVCEDIKNASAKYIVNKNLMFSLIFYVKKCMKELYVDIFKMLKHDTQFNQLLSGYWVHPVHGGVYWWQTEECQYECEYWERLCRKKILQVSELILDRFVPQKSEMCSWDFIIHFLAVYFIAGIYFRRSAGIRNWFWHYYDRKIGARYLDFVCQRYRLILNKNRVLKIARSYEYHMFNSFKSNLAIKKKMSGRSRKATVVELP